jgi:hypothetical protein
MTALVLLTPEEADELERSPGSGATRPATGVVLERRFFRRYWQRYASHPTLLVAHQPAWSIDGATDIALHIVGVGRADGGPSDRNDALRRVLISQISMLRRGHPFDHVAARLGRRADGYVRRATSGVALNSPLPKATEREFLAALQRDAPEVSQLLMALPRPPPRLTVSEGAEADRTTLRHDRLWTALRMFGLRPSAASPIDTSDLPGFALSVQSRVQEGDIIADDSAVFPDWTRSSGSRRGWWQFEDEDRRLLIKNVDRSSVEAWTGADLIYVRTKPDALVLVQYKLLEVINEELGYRPDRRFRSQLSRLERVAQLLGGSASADDEASFRLAEDCTFFKFVDVEKPLGAPGSLVKGHYVSTRYLQRHSDEIMAAGKRGGGYLPIPRLRTLTSAPFAALVHRALIGSVGTLTAAIVDAIFDAVLSDATRDVTVALDDRI